MTRIMVYYADFKEDARQMIQAVRSSLMILGCLGIAACSIQSHSTTTETITSMATSSDYPAQCSLCHGSSTNPAPPRDTKGNTATTSRGVGAHQAHLSSALSANFDCTACHPAVSLKSDSAGHIQGGAASVPFGDLAKNAGATPEWDGLNCSNTYCHGATLKGGKNRAPFWTTVDGSQAQCDSCHGFPPPAPHPQKTSCSDCHSSVVDGQGHFVNRALHVNGTIDVDADLSCNACHGNAESPAPPSDLSGNSATSAKGVGAHRSHLNGSSLAGPVACSECHLVPSSADSEGHIDGDSVAEVTFGSKAKTGGVNPAWNGTNCSNTYCHGATLHGGKNRSPVWTTVDGTQTACDSCHGNPPPAPHPVSTECSACHKDSSFHINGTVDLKSNIDCTSCHAYPPPSPHPQRTACSKCHSTVVDASGKIINWALHANGTLNVDSPLSCNACHGDDSAPPTFAMNTTAVPPKDVAGNMSTTFIGVGAHQAHILGLGNITRPISCNECHVVPTSWTDAGHNDALPAEVVFGTTAKHWQRNGNHPDPIWSRNTATCSDTYCHNPDPTDSAAMHNTPIWTTVDESQETCTSCHGMPPVKPSGLHSVGSPYNDPSCLNSCHSLVMSVSGVHFAITCKSWHMNGLIDFAQDGPCPD